MLYYTIPYHTLPYHTVLYYIIPYHTIRICGIRDSALSQGEWRLQVKVHGRQEPQWNWPIYHIPYTIDHIPYTIYHRPYTIYHVLYTIYTIYHIPYRWIRTWPVAVLCSAWHPNSGAGQNNGAWMIGMGGCGAHLLSTPGKKP